MSIYVEQKRDKRRTRQTLYGSDEDKRELKVLDEDGADVTPQPLTLLDPDASKQSMFFQDGGSVSDSDLGQNETISTFPFDTTTQYIQSYLSLEPEESLPVFDLQRTAEEAETVKEMAEDISETLVDIWLTETDTITLLDIPSTVLPDYAEEAEQQKESNRHSIELCKTKHGNYKFMEREMQTLDNAPKTKSIQTDTVFTAEAGTQVTNWEIYNCVSDSTAALDIEESEITESLVRSNSNSTSTSSSSSTGTGTDSTESSLSVIDYNMDGSQNGPQPQTVMSSKEFMLSLLVMERNVMANIFQPQLASYRQLPPLPDPYHADTGLLEEEKEKEEERAAVSEAPALSLLWSFSCELTRGCVVTSLCWHKEKADILAVGYDCSACKKDTPGLICVWSVKNLMWPERVIHSHSAVTTLDFSPTVPHHLGVGMMDGTVAVYNVASRCCLACISECSKRHLERVSQLSWNAKPLISLSLNGLIKTWSLVSKGLECTDLFQLKNETNSKRLTTKKSESVMGQAVAQAVDQGLCLSFHPMDSNIYLVGTRDGLIHMFSKLHLLETYEKHFGPVNGINWSPFSPDLFLSCSSDWTVQLWRRGSPDPVRSFMSSQTAVYGVQWSPKWPTVFTVLKAEQLEIWDLKMNILEPTLVLRAGAVKLTSVRFCSEADAVVVGDAQGEVKVHKLHNFRVGDNGQVVKLENVI